MVLDDAGARPARGELPRRGGPGASGGGGLALLDASTGELALRRGGRRRAARSTSSRRAGVRELRLPAGRRDAARVRGAGPGGGRAGRARARRRRLRARRRESCAGHLGVASARRRSAWATLPLRPRRRRRARSPTWPTRSAAVPRHVDRLSLLATEDVLHARRGDPRQPRAASGPCRAAGGKGSLLGAARPDRHRRRAAARLARVAPLPAPRPRCASSARLDAVEELRRLVGGARGPGRGAAAGGRPGAARSRGWRSGRATPRDLRALAAPCSALPGAGRPARRRGRRRCSPGAGARAARRWRRWRPHLDRAVAEEPPAGLERGRLIRRGLLGRARRDRRPSPRTARRPSPRLEAQERERTGIGSLKVRYNRVFGYYLEVTKPNLHLVPTDYERRADHGGRRALRHPRAEGVRGEGARPPRSGASRWRSGSSRSSGRRWRREAGAHPRRAADAVATADALLSLARVAAERGYARPEVDASEVLEIVDGRHPVVEALAARRPAAFVPNDVRSPRAGDEAAAAARHHRPQHGRQEHGHAPGGAHHAAWRRWAASCRPGARGSGWCDRIFTRVGASDDLARGQLHLHGGDDRDRRHPPQRHPRSRWWCSTRLAAAPPPSTALSIAWAVAEHLHDADRRRTLFATHYHELQDLARERPAVKNLHRGGARGGRAGGVPAQAGRGRRLAQLRHRGGEAGRAARPRCWRGRARSCRTSSRWRWTRRGHAALAHGRRRQEPSPAAQLGLFARPGSGRRRAPAGARRRWTLDALRPIDALNLLAGWKRKHAP